MKKNISINISGIIFHIEEDGYENLRKYLDSVNRYFASFDDSSEILADIEGRIAEIFLAKLNEGKQVITVEDVNSLIATMGSVSDFKAAEEKETVGESTQPKQEKTSQATSTTPPRKLYRDRNRKILGGVCSGLGNYFGIDPVWLRLALVLLALGTSGFFVLVYIVMWIVVPEADLQDESNIKKMYRDPDKRVLGGVAAGVAAFFNSDLGLIRVLFVIGAFFGLGFIAYIVLWIVLPEAKTITEKMQMQGEPVTLSNIESSVKKNMNERDGAEESLLTRIILFPFRAIGALLNLLAPVLRVLLDVVRVAIGLMFTVLGFILMLVMILCFGMLLGVINFSDWQMFSDWYLNSPNIPIDAIRNSFSGWMVLVTFMAAFIPALLLVLLGSSIIARRIVFRPVVGWTLFVIFFISVAAISFGLPQVIYGFKEEGEYRVEEVFPLTGKTPVLNIRETGLDDYDVTSITFRGHDGKEIRLVERFISQGSSRKSAAENAQMVEYHVTQNDSIIYFDSNITFKPSAKFRAQRLDLEVLIPFNQPFVVDANLWRIIDNRAYSGSYYYRPYRNEDTNTWRITEEGLECMTCPTRFTSDNTTPHDEYGLKDFNAVELKGWFSTRIEQGDSYAVKIDGPPSELKHYEVYVSGQTLVIDYESKRKMFWKKDLDREMKIYITMPRLRELDVQGAGKIDFRGFDEEEVDINLTGAIMAAGDMSARNVNINLKGASYLDLSGKGKFMEAELIGASGLRAYGFEVDHCIVDATGAASAKVQVNESLEIKKSLASSVSHRGNPKVIRR